MEHEVVTRIVRDVADMGGLEVSVLAVEPIEGGWRVAVTDAAGRMLTHDIKADTPAAIRAAIDRWLHDET